MAEAVVAKTSIAEAVKAVVVKTSTAVSALAAVKTLADLDRFWSLFDVLIWHPLAFVSAENVSSAMIKMVSNFGS